MHISSYICNLLIYNSILSQCMSRKTVYLVHANVHTNHLLAHFDHHYCKQVLYYKTMLDCWDRSHLNPLVLVGYLCYLHLGLDSVSTLGNNKDILLAVGFNFNLYYNKTDLHLGSKHYIITFRSMALMSLPHLSHWSPRASL